MDAKVKRTRSARALRTETLGVELVQSTHTG
jgi:hypothetical protein